MGKGGGGKFLREGGRRRSFLRTLREIEIEREIEERTVGGRDYNCVVRLVWMLYLVFTPFFTWLLFINNTKRRAIFIEQRIFFDLYVMGDPEDRLSPPGLLNRRSACHFTRRV